METLAPRFALSNTGLVGAGPHRADPTQRRVLHVVNGEHYAGAERVQDLLASRLSQFGFAAGLACVKPDQFPRVRTARDVPLYTTPMRAACDFRAVRPLVALVRGGDYQLLHTHTSRTVMLGSIVARLTGVPLVHHVHSPASRDSTRRVRNRINRLIEHVCFGHAARLIAVSTSLRDYLVAEGVSPASISVVPNGVPSVPIESLPGRKPGGIWQLGTVALFRPRKGMETLLAALAYLKERRIYVELDAVGCFESRAYEAEIKRLAARLGLAQSIRWVGFSNRVLSALKRWDLFVLPSLYGEGMPMVILEAMAAGVPIIASRVDGIPEAIRHGVDGLLVPPADPSRLADAIASCVWGRIDPRPMAARARLRHAKHFSDAAMVARVAEVYREVLSTDRD